MKNKINKKSTLREVLQIVGTELLREGFNNNIHVATTIGSIKTTDNVIITDTRFENELKAVKDRGGITIRVNRPDFVENALTGEKFLVNVHRNEHPSETALDTAEFDYVIDNSGSLKDLEEKVLEILRKEKLI